MRIRPFRPADAPALAALFHAAVRKTGRRDYSDAQVRAWSAAPPDPARYVTQAADGRALLVAVDADDVPLGYGDVERDGHIDHLYCRPDVTGTGVGGAIYAALEVQARLWGIATLHVEASEAARRLFERRGFSVVGRNDMTIAGVAIHNFRMSRRL